MQRSYQLLVGFLVLTCVAPDLLSQQPPPRTISINIPSTPPPPGADPSTCWFWGIDNNGSLDLNLQPYKQQGVILYLPLVTNVTGVYHLPVVNGQPCNPEFLNLGTPIVWASVGAEELEFDPRIAGNIASVSLTQVSTFCSSLSQGGGLMGPHPDLIVTSRFSDGTESSFTIPVANGATVSVNAPQGKFIFDVVLTAVQTASCVVVSQVVVAGNITFSSFPNSLRLKIQETDGGIRKESIDVGTVLTEQTLAQQTFKLGQSFSLQVVALQPDGSEGAPISAQESVSAVSPNNPTGSNITNTALTLFDGKVLLHLNLNHTSMTHEFFGIHSGTATVSLNFQEAGKNFLLHIPIRVVTCSFDMALLACDPGLSKAHLEFDKDMMKFSDRSGIPPQIIKAQVAQESAFKPDAYRYEPLSFDFKLVGRSAKQLTDVRLAPWRFGVSSDCRKTTLPQGTSLERGGRDANSRERFQIQLNKTGVPLCQVSSPNNGASHRTVMLTDAVVSMENIFWTNNSPRDSVNWSLANPGPSMNFGTYQKEGNPPFAAQTAIAASYGLHQVMYATAVQLQKYVDNNKGGIGRPPSSLFDPATALDLGASYLARMYRDKAGSESLDFESLDHLFYQYGPALSAYNVGLKNARLTFNDIFQACGPGHSLPPPTKNDKNKRFRYACSILTAAKKYTPAALNPANGGSQ